MTVADVVVSAIRGVKLSHTEAGSRIGFSLMQFSQRINRGTLRMNKFLELLDAIGIEMRLYNKETGEEIPIRVSKKDAVYTKGKGRRIRQMVDGVNYDTERANAIANNFYESDPDSIYTNGWAMELYVTENGQFFFAEYSGFEGVKDRITPVSAKDAAIFIEQHSKGTEKTE